MIFVLLGVIWGSSFLFIKVALDQLTPFSLVFIRIVVASVSMLLFAVVRGGLWRAVRTLSRIERAAIAGGALCTYALPYFMITYGESRISASMAGMLNSTTPLFTVLLTPIFIKVRGRNPRSYIGVLVGLVGVVIVLSPWRSLGGVSEIGYDVVVLLAAALYGLGIIIQKKFLVPSGMTSVQIAALQLGVSSVLYIAIAIFYRASLSGIHMDQGVGFSIVLGVVNTAIAGLLSLSLTRLVTPALSSSVTYLIAVVAVAAGVVFLSEPVTLTFLAGSIITFLGLYILNFSATVRENPSPTFNVRHE